jgi:neutral ceramidase
MGIHEGIAVSNIREVESLLTDAIRAALNEIVGVAAVHYARATLERRGHLPKPVVVMPGIEHPPAVPQILPVQLLLIGNVAILGVPGELTTMAGRRLRCTVRGAMASICVTHVALATYANEYSQYITTHEEYCSQHYEGASTLFGPYTLDAYRHVAARLATAIAKGAPVDPGPEPTEWTARRQRRFRFRNLSDSPVHLRFYKPGDRVRWVKLPRGEQTIDAGAEVACPERHFTGPLMPTIRTVTVEVHEHVHHTMEAGQLLTISEDGSISITGYTPPPRRA